MNTETQVLLGMALAMVIMFIIYTAASQVIGTTDTAVGDLFTRSLP